MDNVVQDNTNIAFGSPAPVASSPVVSPVVNTPAPEQAPAIQPVAPVQPTAAPVAPMPEAAPSVPAAPEAATPVAPVQPIAAPVAPVQPIAAPVVPIQEAVPSVPATPEVATPVAPMPEGAPVAETPVVENTVVSPVPEVTSMVSAEQPLEQSVSLAEGDLKVDDFNKLIAFKNNAFDNKDEILVIVDKFKTLLSEVESKIGNGGSTLNLEDSLNVNSIVPTEPIANVPSTMPDANSMPQPVPTVPVQDAVPTEPIANVPSTMPDANSMPQAVPTEPVPTVPVQDVVPTEPVPTVPVQDVISTGQVPNMETPQAAPADVTPVSNTDVQLVPELPTVIDSGNGLQGDVLDTSMAAINTSTVVPTMPTSEVTPSAPVVNTEIPQTIQKGVAPVVPPMPEAMPSTPVAMDPMGQPGMVNPQAPIANDVPAQPVMDNQGLNPGQAQITPVELPPVVMPDGMPTQQPAGVFPNANLGNPVDSTPIN